MNKIMMYRKTCKECGKEMLSVKIKEEICWRCREKIRKGIRRSGKEYREDK